MYTQPKKSGEKRWVDWLALACLVALFVLASSRLKLTNWADNLEVTGWLLVLGGGIGYLLGYSRLRLPFRLGISILSTIVVIPAIFSFFVSTSPGLWSKLVELWLRILSTIDELLANQPVSDSIMFLVGVGILFWILGLVAGFSLVRSGKPWLSVIVLAVSIIIMEHYQPLERKSLYSWAFVFVGLLLLGRIFFLRLQDSFVSRGKRVASDTGFDFIKGILLLAFSVSFLAWVMPGMVRSFLPGTTEQTLFTDRWNNFTSRFENLFFSLEQSGSNIEERTAQDLLLGTGQILGEEEVLFVDTNSYLGLSHPYYWRGKVYDVYQNGRWSVGTSYGQIFRPSDLIRPQVDEPGFLNLSVSVISLIPELSQVYITGEPVHFNRTVRGVVSSGGVFTKDVLAYFITPPIRQGEMYRFDTTIATPSALQLRSSSELFPEWILSRYLQMPDEVTPRLLALAQEITAGKESQFDKVNAVTLYLRQNIEYQNTISAPPRRQDPIDWFLFDYQKGFCNYSASAEVLLLRAAGIPARLAVGYAQGSQGSNGTVYVVRRDDSHAWPEVYFPDFGWIPFEPTGSRPYDSLARAVSSGSSSPLIGTFPLQPSDDLAGLMNGEERANRYLEEIGSIEGLVTPPPPPLSLFGKIVLLFLIVIILAVLVIIPIRIWKDWTGFKRRTAASIHTARRFLIRLPVIGLLVRMIGLSSVERNFLFIEQSLSIFGENSQVNLTPQEMASHLSMRLPMMENSIKGLLVDLQKEIYGHSLPAKATSSRVAIKVLVAALKYRFSDLSEGIKRFNRRFS